MGCWINGRKIIWKVKLNKDKGKTMSMQNIFTILNRRTEGKTVCRPAMSRHNRTVRLYNYERQKIWLQWHVHSKNDKIWKLKSWERFQCTSATVTNFEESHWLFHMHKMNDENKRIPANTRKIPVNIMITEFHMKSFLEMFLHLKLIFPQLLWQNGK